MTSIYEIVGWSDVGSFLIWTLAVCAAAKALFGSLPMAELQYRLSLRDTPRRQQASRLNWEVHNHMKWNEDAARGSPHAAAVPLTDVEVKIRLRELQRLSHNSLPWRAFTYFMGCFACQAFWSAVLIRLLCHGAKDPLDWLLTSLAYSGAASMLMMVVGRTSENTPCSGSGDQRQRR